MADLDAESNRIADQLASTELRPALDLMPIGVAAVDAGCHLLWANRAAYDVLVANAHLAVHEGVVTPARAVDRERFLAVVAGAAAKGRSRPGHLEAALALRRADQAALHLLVLACRLASGDSGRQSGALLLFAGPGGSAGVSPDLLARLYGFTPTQARVAALLADGLTLGEVAHELGIAGETAWCHLRRLFAQTGTHRQAELVAVLLRGPAGLRLG